MTSAISNDENTAIMMALGIFYPLLLLSGIVWPIQGIPVALRWVVVRLLIGCRSKVNSIGCIVLHFPPLHIISLPFPSLLKPLPSPLGNILPPSLLINLYFLFFTPLIFHLFLLPTSLPSNWFSYSFPSISTSSTFFPLASSLYILILPTIPVLLSLLLSFSYLFYITQDKSSTFSLHAKWL